MVARARLVVAFRPYGQVQSVSRHMATSAAKSDPSAYANTVSNLAIGKQTRVIYQGFTGKAATSNAKETITFGTNVVGGVSPNKGGSEHIGLPVFSTMREAMDKVKPHATAVFVPAILAARAIEEAIEAEVPLIVSVAEHIPVHDMLRVQQMLRTQSKSRLLGANCPGIVSSEGCRIGIIPFMHIKPGCVGIVSKSGTLSYEAIGETTRAGLGQSMVIGVGGDMLPGTTLLDGLEFLLTQKDTKGIVFMGEIGGEAEFNAAERIRRYRAETTDPKPIVALITGKAAARGKVMGHAGAVLRPLDRLPEEKEQALRDAGAVVIPHPGFMGSELKKLLAEWVH